MGWIGFYVEGGTPPERAESYYVENDIGGILQQVVCFFAFALKRASGSGGLERGKGARRSVCSELDVRCTSSIRSRVEARYVLQSEGLAKGGQRRL
jgi:hypothetical protein